FKQPQLAMSSAKESHEGLREARVDGFERFLELAAAYDIDLVDGLDGVADRIEQVLALRVKEHEALFGFLVFLDGHHVDGPHRIQLVAQLAILLLVPFKFGWRQSFKILQA